MGGSRNDGNGASHKTFPIVALGAILLFFMVFSANGQTIYQCDFEDETENLNWTLDNGDETNQWYIGSAASNGGENGLYITNDGGESNEYTATATSYVYAYRTFELTETALYEVSFDWLGYGENNYDLLHAFIIPTSLNPTLSAGDANGMTGNTNTIPSGWIDISNINEELNYATTWQHSEKKMTMEVGTYYLVFFWKNNNSNGNNPPAVVDNISIVKDIPATLPYTCDFEDENENSQWTFANLRNKWYIGTAANNGGSNGLYISNDGGESNAYTNSTATTCVYAYRTLEFTESAIYEISFDWRANGQSTYDFLRALMIPVSRNPTLVAGNTSGISDYGSNYDSSNWMHISNPEGALNLVSSWQHSEKELAIEAGTYYLVFYWKNNNSSGNQPPAAIDNISIQKSSCLPVTDIRVGDITAESVTISWTEPGFAESWEVIFSETELDETELANYADVEIVSDTPSYTATGLNLSSTYYVYIRPICIVDDENEWNSFTYRSLRHIPITLPYSCDFEDDTENANWVLTPDGQTNAWNIGSATNNGGSNGLYISNDGGESYECDNGAWSYSFAYREIDITQTGKYLFSFDWKSKGKRGSAYLKAFLVSTSIYPDFTDSYISDNLYDISEGIPEGWIDISSSALAYNRVWRNNSKLIDIDAIGTYYLVFYWENNSDNGDYNPPAAIDNIELRLATAPVVVTNIATTVDASSVRLKGSITYGGIAEVSERGFLFGSSADNLDQTLQSTDLTNEFTYAVTGLVTGETYYFKAFATNSSGTSYGKVKSFTPINPDSYNIIYSCDFEDDAENQNWILDRPDEEDPTYWMIGNELSNSGEKSMYVVWEYESEIHYGNANSISAYAYREIDIPFSGEYWFKFDWIAIGESELDYIRAFIVPVSLNPYLISGYYSDGDGLDDNYIGNTTVPDGWIDISEDIEMSGVGTWRTSRKKTIDVEAGAYYLVFYWTDDGTSGGDPGVIDNILVKTPIFPFVETTTVTNTDAGAVTLSGTLLDDGDTEVTQRGFMFGDNIANLNENLLSSSTGENFTYELTGLVPGKLYYYKAYATNSKGTDYGDIKAFLAPSGVADGYGYVDLGLPSGTKWATMNIGANSPEKLGGYYAWGETEAREDFNYGYSYSDNLDTLPVNADAASVNWSDKWRMPTSVEMQELVENCTWTWTKMNGVSGYMVNTNSKSIFLPAAGKGSIGYYSVGYEIYTNGFYWTSSIAADNTSNASALLFQESEYNMGNESRSSGFSIRAIYKASPTVSTNFVSNMTISTATLNGSILSGGSSDVTECGFMFGTDSTNLDQNFIIPDIGDEFSYQLTDLMAKKTYYYKAYAINSEGTSYGELRSFKVPSGIHNGHEYVDLGLPSCTMWAISNVGASSIEDYGNYYAWGETEVKDNYSSSTNRYHDDSGYTKYNSSDGLTTLESDDDAAFVNWGGSWRMPTLSELEELYRYCSHEVVDQNGVHGLRISGNGNSIFLPSAGYYSWGPFNEGNISYYWSSTVHENTNYAVALNSNYENFVYSDLREYGLSVRAVYSACKYVTDITVSDITTESATISWREQGDAENWEMIISEEEIGEAELDLFDNILTLADTSYSAEGLNPGTLYHVYVRAVCSIDNTSAWKSQTFNTRYLPQIPSTVPYSCDFEDEEENSKWTLSYGGQVNSWYIGTAANNGGSNGMYISNDNGESNQYSNNSSSYAYAFRTIEIPYTANYSISYDWRFVGDGGFSDYLYVFLAHDSLNYNFISGVNQQYFSNCIYVVDYDYSEEAIWRDYSSEKHIEAGTYHLVFNWANDDDGNGDNPPAGIDNISIRMICPEITNLTVAGITSEAAKLVWTKEDLAERYEIVISETALDEAALEDYDEKVSVTDSLYSAAGLTPQTTYYVYVRTVCLDGDFSSWENTTFTTMAVPVTLPYTCDFENAEENAKWTLNNGNQTNKWHIGTAANNGGDNGLYISNDDGETNEYSTGGASYVYAIRDIQVDVTATYQVSYDWRSYGLSHWDAVWAVLIPKSANANLSAGESNGMVDYYSELPEEWIDIYEQGGAMSTQPEWQTSNKYVNLEAETYSLVFFWRNSGRGSQPPAAIDNISIVKVCLPVEHLRAFEITYESATINWNRNFNITDYVVKFSSTAIEEGNLETTTADVFDGNVSDTVKVISGLIPTTAYYVYVRSICSVDEYSQWDSITFKSYQIPVEVPYSCNFENAEENANWLFANEGQTNQWHIGTAANNGGTGGLYISSDEGENNMYDNNAASYVYAYRDIQVNETGFYHIGFDWRAQGFNYYNAYKLDVLRAFLVPNTQLPDLTGGNTNGMFNIYTSIINATPEGWIELSGNGPMLEQSEWQNCTKELTIEAGTYKLIFYWQNISKDEFGLDEGGSNPPAGIDNISVWKISCPPVSEIRITDIAYNSATISWAERGSATSWKMIVSDEAIEDSELNESGAAVTVEDNPLYSVNGLNPTTKYYVYISAVCSADEISTWECKTFTTPNRSATLFYYCDFEDEDENENWDLSLTYSEYSSGTNLSWEIGAQYDNNNEHNLNAPVVSNAYGDYRLLAYRTITLDSDDYYYKIDFDWRTNSADVYIAAAAVLIPDTAVISENISIPSSGIMIKDGYMRGDNGWQHSTYKSKIAAGDYKLAFLGGVSGRTAHDAYFEIDNIFIYKSQFSEPIVETALATDVSAASATLSGSITDNGGIEITERGFVYGTSDKNLNMRVQSSNETDEFSAEITGLVAGNTYYYKAYAVNNEGTGYGNVNSFIVPSGYYNGYAYIDLGLPSGLLWATMNVGASAFDELGDKYAWGETETKDEYTGDNYTYTDNPETLPSEVDVAAINWGGSWQTPTKEELEELFNNTTRTIIKREEGSDYLFRLTGPNGNSIFFRAEVSDAYMSLIMSRTLYPDEQESAYSMGLASFDGIGFYFAGVMQAERSQGFVVRPVYAPRLASSYDGEEIYYCDFEDDAENENWTIQGENSGQTNYWIIGNKGGSNCLYITYNGTSNGYMNETSSVFAYRALEIPERANYNITFNWLGSGEENFDFMRAFLVPTSANPDLSAGISLGEGESGANNTPDGWLDLYYGQMNNSEVNQMFDSTMVINAGTYYLVFYWHNNGSGGSNPSARVDNILIKQMPPVEVVTQNAVRTSTTATLSGELSIVGDCEISNVGFEYGTRSDLLLDTVKMAYNEDAFTSLITGLVPQTTYYYRAFATFDGDKTVYGDLVQFRTKTNDTDGTEDNPLTIDNAEEWMAFADSVGMAGGDTINTYKGFEFYDHGDDVYFKLTADLDFAECGNQGPNMFKGHFNGGGKTITFSNTGQGTVPSAFVYINNATVDSLNILIAESFEIETGEGIYGALGLSASSSSISNCTVLVANAEVVLQSGINAGGIIGMAQNSNITNCTNNLSINVTSSMSFAGGIAVGISGGSVNSCTNNASIAARYGAGGIVGLISEKGASISSCLNTGNINGIISAGGILGVGMNVSVDAVTIDKCMNTGKLSATVAYENYFGGIAGLCQDCSSNISISNCANYGSFSELLLATGGIFGVGSVSLSKNIAAPIYESASVSADNNGYNVYSTIAAPDGHQEQYPFAETDDFFDEQVGDIRVDSLRLKFAERGTAKETSQIIGTALQSTLSTNWTYTDGLYPMPAGIPENTKATLARVPIYLATGETAFGVRSNFTVPTTISGQPVTWTSDNAAISISDGTATVTRPAEGENDIDVNITAEYDGYTKTFVVRVIAPKHIPVNTGDAVPDSVVTLNGSFDMETVGVTYVREYGFVYSINGNLADSTKVVSTNLRGLGPYDERNFSASLNGLEEGTRYYYAAFATTGDTTMLGEIKTFRTEGAPDITMYYPTWRDTISVGLKAKVDMLGDLETHKFYIGLDINSLSEVSDEAIFNDEDSTFTVTASGLAPETFYYAVAEATDEYGTARSDTLSFYTYGHFKDDRDNTDYYTIKIGDQTWMAENLKYTGDGASLGTTTSDSEPYYYYPRGDEANVATYGYLYNWSAAMNGANSSSANPSGVQGICPNGWHLPSDAEWTQLTNALGGTANAGSQLAGRADLWPNRGLIASSYFGMSGFVALPAGNYSANYSGVYGDFGTYAYFWSITEIDSNSASNRAISYAGANIQRLYAVKYGGFSIRCLKGTTIYVYDTVNYCGDQYTFGTQTLTVTGDYEETFNLGTDKDSIVYLHLMMYPELTATISSFSNGCHGANNGFVEVSATGGSGSYSYLWNDPEQQTTARLVDVGAGEYVVNVTDAVGCSVTASQTLTEPDELTASLSSSLILCNGGTSDITNTVAGGTTPYTFAWSNNATTQNLTGVDAGTYNLTVTDANNCTIERSVTVSQPDVLTVSLSADEILCNGQTTNIVSTIAGGTTPYTYLWSNSETTANLTDVEASVYGVTVTDANGCVATATANISQPTALTVEISGSLSVCEGTTTTLTANALGGTADYEYLWSNDVSNATFTTPNITEATPYSVTVTDANGCTAVASETVVIGDTPAVEISAENAVCYGNDVVLQANVSNAGTGYTVTWSASPTEGAGLLTTDGERITVTPTTVNTYTYTATLNANSCSNGEPFESTDDIEVVVNALPDATIANNTGETAITCSITEISLTATGGTAYLWSNGMSTAENIIGDEGTYSVTVTDANGCSSTTQIEISNDTDAPNVQITSDETEITCAVTEIPLQASGAVSYQWSSGAVTSTLTVSAEGTYMVTGTATNGCTSTASIDITEDLTVPNANIENITETTTLTCSTPSIEITAQGGEQYTWSDTQWNGNANQTVTQAGTYIVTVTGANGCTAVSSISITQDISVPDVVASASEETICLNASTALSAAGAVTYQWSPETGLSSTDESEVTATPTVTTTYTVVGTADNGCTASAEVTVTVNMPLAYEFEQTSCNMFEWNGQIYAESGNYEQTFTAVNGCDSVVTLHLTINTSVTSEFSDTACDSYQWNDSVYTASGDYVQTLQTTNGCDSVVTLHLTVNYTTNGVFADRMCSGVPYEYEGQTFAEAGTYEVILINASGCDSIVTLTLTYANNCNGTISGIITDANTGEAIPDARVTVGNKVTRTNAEGEYSLTVLRGRKSMRVSAVDYMSYADVIDIQSDTVRNIELYMPQITMDVDSISVTSYPYLAQNDSITLRNIGNTTLIWSSVTEYDNLSLLPDEETHQRRNSRSLWDSIQTFTTQFNAEQAIATDGFFIYTSSWQRPGEFNRYTPDGEYIETFYIENVGMIRNLSFDGTYFYGTEATNIIFKLDLDNQTLVDSITTDISNIRHCSFDRQNGTLLAGSWNTLYSIDTATGVSTQIRSDLMNVYSSAYDNLSPGGPYLWLFSQASQNNGPSAYIRQFSIDNADYTDKTHYLDDLGLSNSSLAGGICASEKVKEGKFVLLADIQNPSGNNIIATYEIGRTNSIVTTEQKSGRIMPNESMKIAVREHATEVGDFTATIRYRAAVMGRQTSDVDVTISAVAPECNAVQQITAVTDTFHTITLDWQSVELGDYNSVSYFIFRDNSQFAIDTITETTITYEGLPVGEHCFSVRAMSVGEYACVSESSDTVCAEIEDISCNVALTAEATNDGESIFLSWNKPVGVEYFRIHRNDESEDIVLYDDNYTDSNVVPEIEYCYTIIAYFEDGICNELVATACSKIVSGLCADAPVLYVEAFGGSIALSWTGNGDSYSYRIFRNNFPIGLTTDTTYYDNVARGFEYCYKVESLCEYGMFVYSDEECIFIEEASDEEEGNAIAEWTADNLTVYPNPTYGQFFIEGPRIATVMIYNASGQLVAEIDSTESERISIDCAGWNPGLYNIRIISTEGQAATRKVSVFR